MAGAAGDAATKAATYAWSVVMRAWSLAVVGLDAMLLACLQVTAGAMVHKVRLLEEPGLQQILLGRYSW